MKKYYPLCLMLLSLAVMTSCDDDDEVTPEAVVEVETVSDLDASGTHYAFYDLEGNTEVPYTDSASTEWDIAFKGTSVLINGGSSGPGTGAAQVVDGIFAEIEEAPETGYVTDAAGAPAIVASSDKSWYHYTGTEANVAQHAILPIAGKLIVLKTANGNYAKVEILSYYKGNPNTTTEEFVSLSTRPTSKVYTFQYAVQPNGSREFLD
ncbi:HmuY family protein [Pontibacter silvestris]|uniref:HmuY family protein n=1 Tax=Pontibacter silvestris TaxID=2305183 RepID=A0ABW4X3A5_9BACT|nr:HmuY family protein [Pontibacter silvestris]MCC9134872.1 HmuY family protein [Pontibacter silvestris]